MKMHKFNLTVICMTAFLSIIMLLFFVYPEKQIIFSEETKKTNAILSAYDDVDIEMIKTSVSQVQNNIKQVANVDNKSLLKNRFVNAVVLGDSIAEGLLDYRILDESVCIGKRGARINSIDEDFNTIKTKKPTYVFLEYGLNDMGYWSGDADRFIALYEEKITMIQTELPNAKIYINGILPMDQTAISNNPMYANYIEFNSKIEALCKKIKCKYIDNSFILDQLEVKYEFDGVHPKYDYYYLWALNMAYAAGL